MEGPEINQQVYHFYADTTVTEEAKNVFASQTFLGWEDALQGRFGRAWQVLSPDKNWRKPFVLELMNWG